MSTVDFKKTRNCGQRVEAPRVECESDTPYPTWVWRPRFPVNRQSSVIIVI